MQLSFLHHGDGPHGLSYLERRYAMTYQSVGEAIHAAIEEVDATLEGASLFDSIKLEGMKNALEEILVSPIKRLPGYDTRGTAFEDMDLDDI